MGSMAVVLSDDKTIMLLTSFFHLWMFDVLSDIMMCS